MELGNVRRPADAGRDVGARNSGKLHPSLTCGFSFTSAVSVSRDGGVRPWGLATPPTRSPRTLRRWPTSAARAPVVVPRAAP